MNEEIELQEIKEMLDEMMEMGFIKIVSYTDAGEPRYAVTELGRLELAFNTSD
jgi:hypothetical protein